MTGYSRRDFLSTSGSALGGAWLAVHLSAIQAACVDAGEAARAGAPFEILTPEEARELEAIAAQIFPTDETPGAREAGVIHFVDRALGSFLSSELDSVRKGLAGLQARVSERYGDPGSGGRPGAGPAFSELEPAAQVETLRAIENGSFFGLVRSMTVIGMLAHPDYGGNRDEIGWRMVGFEDRPVWEPPFGYYDAEAAGSRGQGPNDAEAGS